MPSLGLGGKTNSEMLTLQIVMFQRPEHAELLKIKRDVVKMCDEFEQFNSPSASSIMVGQNYRHTRTLKQNSKNTLIHLANFLEVQ